MSDAGDEAVLKLCQEFWDWRLSQSPELGSFCGFHQYDDSWDDIGEEAHRLKSDRISKFSSQAALLAKGELSEGVALSLDLLRNQLQIYLEGNTCRSRYFPISFLEGIHTESNLTISYMKFNKEADIDKYISRLEKLPARICQVMAMLRQGMEEGFVMHKVSVEKVPGQIDVILNTDIEKVALLEPVSNGSLAKVSLDEGSRCKLSQIEAQAKEIVVSQVFPALNQLKDFINQSYLPSTRLSPGISSLPDGAAHYQRCLDFHLTCKMTPQEIHDIGLREVARIRAEILRIAEVEGLGGSLPEIMKSIAQRQEGSFKSKDEVINYVKHLCHKRIRPKLHKLFKNIPDLPLNVKPFPDYQKTGPQGYYLNGLPDGSRDGVYYINAHHLNDCLPFNMAALSLHEGEPGHHLQMVFTMSATGLPEFRRYCEDSKYYLAPANFPFYTAYVEGWGLYSESLGEEMGVYQDNLEWLGRYSFEIFRAARLVVDTGLHAFGWTRAQAVEYMIDNSLEPESEMNSEVDRYITWPGQACAYKIGEMKLWELRRKAEQELGEKFDLPEFHSRVLNCGQVPIQVLQDVVDRYIQEVKVNT